MTPHPAVVGNYGDVQHGVRLLGTDPSLPSLPEPDGRVHVLADSAYGSGEALAALQAKGHEPIIKPWPVRPAVAGGFTGEDFTVDEAAGTVTCPNGVTRPMRKNRVARFGIACAACPLRARCTTSTSGRDLRIHPHDALQRAHRARAADPGFGEVYRRHRPMVERSIAWLTYGNRRVPFRGVVKNNAWLHRRVAAINLRRLLVLGLQRVDDRWILAQA